MLSSVRGEGVRITYVRIESIGYICSVFSAYCWGSQRVIHVGASVRVSGDISRLTL